jgi:hypothetical protein
MGKCPGRTRQLIKSDGNFIYLFRIENPHSINLNRMYTTDTPIVFIANAPTIFVFVFATLLFIAWIALILWVQLVIARDSNPNEPNDIELAVRGRSPPQPPLHPSPTTLPSSPSRSPPVYALCSCPQSWGNLFINQPLCQRDYHIPSRPLQLPQYYVALFTGEIVRD